MRKLTAMLIAVYLLLSLTGASAAVLDGTHDSADTSIGTTIPDSHKVTITAESATVSLNGSVVKTFQAERLSQPKLLICPGEGQVVTEVLLNGEDVTAALNGGYYDMPAVCRDSTLQVKTAAASKEEHGDHTVSGTVTVNGEPLSGADVELHSELRQAVTDAEGRFRFENVQNGHHTLTIYKDGLIIGYTEFTMKNGKEVSFNKEDNGFYTLTALGEAGDVSLGLELADGKITLTRAQADNSKLFITLLVVLALLAIGSVITALTVRKNKKHSKS